MRTRVERTTLGDSVWRHIWDQIVARQLHPGEKLSDLRLSDKLGVSRTPVREALSRPVQDGIVRAELHHGFSVASFSARDVAEIHDLRAALETTSLRMAGDRLEPACVCMALTDLERVEAMVAAARGETEEIAAAEACLVVDRGFHRWLVERVGNQRLTVAVEGLCAKVAVF